MGPTYNTLPDGEVPRTNLAYLPCVDVVTGPCLLDRGGPSQFYVMNTIKNSKNCVGSSKEHPRGHSWYRWRPTAGDTYVPGITYRYESACQTMGCSVMRFCNELEVVGPEYLEKDCS